MTAMKARQLHAMFPNRVGLLADMAEALARAGINITAINAFAMEGRGEFMLITDDNAAAMTAIQAMGGEVTESDVIGVELPNRVGALGDLARRIASAGVDIKLVYAANYSASTAAVILSTTDDAKVLGLLG